MKFGLSINLKNMKKLTYLTVILLLINANINAQSCTDVRELLRKRHKVAGMTYGHPYTMFDRHNPNYKSLQNAVDNIRNNIIQEKKDSIRPISDTYNAIYTNAKLPRPNDNGIINGEDKSALAIWAKNNAFVFLVGLDNNSCGLTVQWQPLLRVPTNNI